MNKKRMMEDKFASTVSEDFKKKRMNGVLYVDKTALLVPLLRGDHETTFFLRPRKVGKTLALSMIRYFVEDTRDSALNEENRSLFQSLKIMGMGDRYTGMMTSFPVIHLTFETVKGATFRLAYQSLADLIQGLYAENEWLLESNSLDEVERQRFKRILMGMGEAGKEVDIIDIRTSLQYLTEYMRKATGKRAVVLIDEYGVSLENADRNVY